MLGTIQATEILKFFIGRGQLLTDRMLTFNALSMEFRNISFSKNKNCPICGEHPTITKLQTYELPVCEIKH
jgi:adenylyltransferase/sulfurtransferase